MALNAPRGEAMGNPLELSAPKPAEKKGRAVQEFRVKEGGVFVGAGSAQTVRVKNTPGKADAPSGTATGGTRMADAIVEGPFGLEATIKGRVDVVPYGMIRNYTLAAESAKSEVKS